MEFAIGGLAGAGATVFTNPVDVVKTRLQLQGELRGRKDHIPYFRNLPHAMYVIGKREGLRSLQKGLSSAVLYAFAMSSLRLGIYQAADVRGWTKNKEGELSMHRVMFWSSFSGAVGGGASNPASVVKTRMQAASHPDIAVGRQHQYNGMLDAFVKIYKNEGLRGFYAGVYVTMLRIAIGSMTQLTTYSMAKESLYNHGVGRESPFWLAFWASLLSAPAVALVICPLDVISTRLYNQGATSKQKQLYNGILDSFAKIYKTEGLHGFFKGLVPQYFRLAPQTTISLVIWDVLNNIFLKK